MLLARVALRIKHYRGRRRARESKLGHNVRINPTATFDGTPITLGDNTKINHGVILKTLGGSIQLGTNCTVNAYSVISGQGGVVIGNDVRIADHVVLVAANHRFEDPAIPIWQQGETRKGITVGNDVWIGTRAVVLDGVTIGDGAVIGACTVVNRDVPPYTVVVGVPGRVVKYRR